MKDLYVNGKNFSEEQLEQGQFTSDDIYDIKCELENEISSKEEAIEECQGRIDSNQSAIDEKEKEIERLVEQVATMAELEGEELEEYMDEDGIYNPYDLEEMIQKLREEMDELEEDNVSWESEIERLQDEKQEYKDLLETVEDIEDRGTYVKAEPETLKDFIDLTKAQKQYNELLQYIEENAAAFDLMDLKLHEAFATSGKMQDQLAEEGITVWDRNMEDVFYDFCNSYYNEFIQELKEEHHIDFASLQHQYGRTSSFKLHEYSEEPKEMISEISYKLMTNSFDDYLAVDENGQLSVSEGWADYTKEELPGYAERDIEHIENDLFLDVKAELEEIVTAYNLLQDYKAAQVENFNEYAQDIIEDTRDMKQNQLEEARREEVRQSRCQQLDRLTDKLTNTKDFDEMKKIVKQIKDIKDQMRKDEKDCDARNSRSDKDER